MCKYLMITDTVHICVAVMSSSEHTAPSVQQPAGAPTSATARPKPEITHILSSVTPPRKTIPLWRNVAATQNTIHCYVFVMTVVTRTRHSVALYVRFQCLAWRGQEMFHLSSWDRVGRI